MPKRTQLNELAKLLILCRAERRLGLKDVQQATGLSTGWLSELETGKKKSANQTSVMRVEQFLRKHGYFAKSGKAA